MQTAATAMENAAIAPSEESLAPKRTGRDTPAMPNGPFVRFVSVPNGASELTQL